MAYVLFLLSFLALSRGGQSWPGWFSSSNGPSSNSRSDNKGTNSNSLVAEFSIEALDNPKGVELLENAKLKLKGTNHCWFSAYQNLLSSCREIFAEEEQRMRLAWLLSDCFQQDSGRNPFPSCGERSLMVDCLRKLNDHDHKTYLEFYLETNSICHQLQSEAFKLQVESLVNELKRSAQSTEDKLATIEEKSDSLIRKSNQIQESIMSIDQQTRQVEKNLKNMLGDLDIVLEHSKELSEQAKGIATSQVELLDGQGLMRAKMEEGMAKVEESYYNLRQEIEVLQQKAADVEKEVNRFGEVLSSKMQNLQGKADDIADMAGISIEKQQQLLLSQSKALEGLQSLTNFQSEALQESRFTLQQIVGFARGQHQELMGRQEELLQAHDRLASSSKSMLAAQEAFENKQASIFMAIDKLFAVHNAMLLESRLIKAFLIYSVLIFVLYMFTSTKQTNSARMRLYLGLCIAFAIEVGALQFTTTNIEQKTRLRNVVRSLLGAFAVIQLLYSYFTYRDYGALNHMMLATLIDKVNYLQKGKDIPLDDESVDSEHDWLSWMDTELPEDLSIEEDPEFLLPVEEEGRSKNHIVTNIERKYNLRQRKLLKR